MVLAASVSPAIMKIWLHLKFYLFIVYLFVALGVSTKMYLKIQRFNGLSFSCEVLRTGKALVRSGPARFSRVFCVKGPNRSAFQLSWHLSLNAVCQLCFHRSFTSPSKCYAGKKRMMQTKKETQTKSHFTVKRWASFRFFLLQGCLPLRGWTGQGTRAIMDFLKVFFSGGLSKK